MYYKYLINQAYNYIHAGRFRTANRLAKLVLQAVQQGPHEDEVLVKCNTVSVFLENVYAKQQSRMIRNPIAR